MYEIVQNVLISWKQWAFGVLHRNPEDPGSIPTIDWDESFLELEVQDEVSCPQLFVKQ